MDVVFFILGIVVYLAIGAVIGALFDDCFLPCLYWFAWPVVMPIVATIELCIRIDEWTRKLKCKVMSKRKKKED